MKSCWIQIIVWLMVPFTWLSSVHAGGVHYPALGNVELGEGTIELWLTPTVELYPELKEDQYQGLMSLFSLQVPGEFSMNALWYAKNTRSGDQYRLHVSIGHQEQRKALIPVPAKPVKWRRGELHHLAFTWRGKEMSLYADGKRVGHRMQAVGFSGRLGGSELIIGNAHGRDAGFILHAVRVSHTAHGAETQKNAEPVARLDTLLLDRFKNGSIDESHKTRAEIIAGLAGETGGTLHGTYHLTETSKPGIALNGAEEPAQQQGE